MNARLSTRSPARGARRQRGFTLVEMMVALTIGLVITLGFAVSFVNLKISYNAQDQLAQLQDNERLALAFLSSAVDQAGYYPDATAKSTIAVAADATIDPTYGSMSAGQYLMGKAVGTTDSLSTALASASGDGLLNCQGGTNTSGATTPVTYRNVFYVDITKHTLNCLVKASISNLSLPAAPLVTNVSSMSVLYGVDTDGDGSADKYLAASAVTDWTIVKSVQVTINFINPNASIDGTPTFKWVQTMTVMNNR